MRDRLELLKTGKVREYRRQNVSQLTKRHFNDATNERHVASRITDAKTAQVKLCDNIFTL